MGLRLVAFPSIKIILSRDFYFCSIGIFPFGMSCPAASPDGDKGAVAKPLWEEEKAGSDYAGDTRAQLLGCRHARLGCPVLRPLDTWTSLDGQAGHSAAGHLAPQTACLFDQPQLAGWYFWRHSIFAGSPELFCIPAAFRKRKKKKIGKKKRKLKF